MKCEEVEYMNPWACSKYDDIPPDTVEGGEFRLCLKEYRLLK